VKAIAGGMLMRDTASPYSRAQNAMWKQVDVQRPVSPMPAAGRHRCSQRARRAMQQHHNRHQTFHVVLQDALPLGAKITSKISLRFKHNVVCENHSQILTPFGIVIAQALFVVSHMLYSIALFIH
jgi:hypothetical protein